MAWITPFFAGRSATITFAPSTFTHFLLASVITKFEYLKVGLSAVLVFVGAKMLLTDVYKLPIAASLATIAGLLAASIVVSIVKARRAPNDVRPM